MEEKETMKNLNQVSSEAGGCEGAHYRAQENLSCIHVSVSVNFLHSGAHIRVLTQTVWPKFPIPSFLICRNNSTYFVW